ncbi:hypothetical protein LC040_04690 [Bacillus tianshenii]|nr:hypothetical protein LC040_04690 [Bacillus tianshenii]
MLIAAIVIPIIFLYFLMLTRREHRKHHEAWLTSGIVEEHASIRGRVVRLNTSKRIFYQQKRIFTLEVVIQEEERKHTAIIEKPITEPFTSPTLEIGQEIIAYGQWDNKYFRINRFEQLV